MGSHKGRYIDRYLNDHAVELNKVNVNNNRALYKKRRAIVESWETQIGYLKWYLKNFVLQILITDFGQLLTVATRPTTPHPGTYAIEDDESLSSVWRELACQKTFNKELVVNISSSLAWKSKCEDIMTPRTAGLSIWWYWPAYSCTTTCWRS